MSVQTESERGTTLILVAVSMMALLMVASLAVDIGLLWNSKRGLVTATDGAALETAIATLDGAVDPCVNEAVDRLEINRDAATLVECEVAESGPNGIAALTSTEPTELFFAPLFGANRASESASTTVEWGIPNSATGVLPLGLCIDSPGIADFIADPTTPQTATIAYDKDVPADCGDGVPGNWGLLSLDCHLPDVTSDCNSSNSELRTWIEFGYDEAVYTGDSAGLSCTPPVTGCYSGDPGSRGDSFATELGAHIGEERVFPIYDLAAVRGSNSHFHIVAFAKARVDDFAFNGSGRICGAAHRCLILTFTPGLINGGCCADSGSIDLGVRATHICGVVEDDYDRCVNASLL